MPLAAVSLDDKYALDKGRVYLTGTQTLVRLALVQRRLDLGRGLNTAGFVTGYRGSPLGAVDKEFWRAAAIARAHHVTFQAGVNEDLAATAVWGSQQLNLHPGAKYDGVFALWYGKGPGVDRSGDAFRHGNLAGTSPKGGVLVMAGDDPSGKSSTIPSASEYALVDAHIPVLNPCNVGELLAFGLAGWAMSRFSGCWVALKAVTDTIDSAAAVAADAGGAGFVLPEDVEPPPGGLNIRWPDAGEAQEFRLAAHKLPAAQAFARANGLDRTVIAVPGARFGIAATGKAWLDTLQALDALGLDPATAGALGVRLYKVGMPWPLEPEGARRFAEGLDEVLVVEEKRPLIEGQLKDLLFHAAAGRRPRVVGKRDERGEPLLPETGELSPDLIAKVLAKRLQPFAGSERFGERVRRIEERARALEAPRPEMRRLPYFCSGCPHNTSTKVPEGSRAAAGIGCHYMVLWMDRATETYTQMGGEGANWIGQAPFTATEHIFVNIGDGTYFHSGLLAIRAAVAAGVNVTYKILYNDAVAMTGGQPMDGPLDVAMITRQVRAEGVARIAVVAEDPAGYAAGADFAPGTTVHPRDELDPVQRELRREKGVTVLVYDQTCAAEKRRRRKRGRLADPDRRPFINTRVCEGCGDCGVQSNCVAIDPVETEHGRKRAIDQSACNKDFSCLNGFCPSFVTVHGGRLGKPKGLGEAPFVVLPEPAPPSTAAPYDVLIAGIGGTGVVTVSQLLGMAAHLEGKGVSVLDVAGLAQKNGAVYAHVRVADAPERIHATRIAAGGAHLLLGCDMVAAAATEALACLERGVSRAVVNGERTMTADFTRDPDLDYPERGLKDAIAGLAGREGCHFVEATDLARALLGDPVAANILLLGFACQKGLVPVSAAAVERAIELNGVAVDLNKRALLWGRRAAFDGAAVARLLSRPPPPAGAETASLDDRVARRAAELAAYQDRAYGERYRRLVERVRTVEGERAPGRSRLAETVAAAYFKLLAYKDEYEVARLYTDGRFLDELGRQFEGDVRLTFHLAPPGLASRDPATGRLRKREFGPWMMTAFKLLARLRRLRGTAFDPFGYAEERKTERRLIRDYEATVGELLDGLGPDTHALAVEIAAGPASIRGFGHVKAQSVAAYRDCERRLMASFRERARKPAAAE